MVTKPRLRKADWIEGGLAALASDGPMALNAEAMSRRMGTTKGSFYWHFADVPAFHAALGGEWESRALSSLSRALDRQESPVQLLRGLMGQTAAEDRLERAMRGWAASDGKIAKVVGQVDSMRLQGVEALLAAMKLANPDFARLLMAARIGAPQLPGAKGRRDTAPETLIDVILALETA
ncbi:TetR/AcrR family transcriptional regulator [Mesobacterium pallidum]|uniref:TetR/AcrR family transcriptional regulator n=1 Tax=Mesobacterium pallidum TaxID=2872037 RepID=UPI001EE34D18|nr:TetR/AcrR family transcriptional regulator [Mesobacterium pallidum]